MSRLIHPEKSPRARACERVDEPAHAALGAALGTNAKFSSASSLLWANGEPGTGEVVPFVQVGTSAQVAYDPRAVRLERYALQSAARRLLWGSRTAKCLRLRRADKSAVDVWRNAEHGSTHYGGLQTCGSVWACPVCAAKISERRRVELLHAMEQHKANGGECLLLTLTNPHTAADDLPEMLQAQARAMSRLNGSRVGRNLWESIDCIGTVRAWEVTHGQNGWHPHFHVLLFARAGLDLAELRGRFYAAWANACRLAGLAIPSEAYGVTLEDGSKAADYASKGLWGLDREMTKGHTKKARKGRSPFDLLRSYLHDGDKRAGGLFQAYAKAFKGKNQLSWSKGLKALFAIDEQTDEETAARIEEGAELLGQIELEEWREVLRLDLRGEVLELARHGWEPVRRLLDGIGQTLANTPQAARFVADG